MTFSHSRVYPPLSLRIKSFKQVRSKAYHMPKLDRRIAVFWVVTALVVGSFFASLSDVIKQNFWFVIYGALVAAWIVVLTGMASLNLNKESKQTRS